MAYLPTTIQNRTILFAYNRTPFHQFNSYKPIRITAVSNATLKQTPNDWIDFARSVFPGGSWWTLSEQKHPSFLFDKPITVFKPLNQMWALLAQDKWVLYLAFAALTLAAISEIAMPAIITTCIFSAQSGATLVFYRHTRILFLLCIVSGICSGLRGGCFAIANVILVKRLRHTVFCSLLVQDVSFFDRETVGDLTSRIGTDCQKLSRSLSNDVHLILRNVVQGTGAFINLMVLSWPLALSSLLICFILSTVFLIYGLYQKKAAMLAQDYTASANEAAQETLTLIRTVRVYGTEREELRRFMEWTNMLAFVGMRESVAYGLWNLSFMVLYRMTQVFLFPLVYSMIRFAGFYWIFAILFGGISIMSGFVSAEQLTKYVLYCEWLIYAAWRVQDHMSSLLQSFGACEKVFQLMNLNPVCEFLSRGKKLQRLTGCIDFVDVSFHFSSRKMVSVLKNVSFSIPANEIIAIAGVSGSGKSTLINLLLRLYEPSSGEIFINGVPLQEMDIRWLREKIGFVGQEPHLFHMDVKSNITYGCLRNMEQEEIEYAAKNANAHEFISALPNGYDTIVDDNLLSGGQKQRIAIARAILRDPVILILDEATSALDAENEEYIKEIIYSLKNDPKKRKTIIIIAHRLSTLKAADRILVMNNGEIFEIGDHNKLLERN